MRRKSLFLFSVKSALTISRYCEYLPRHVMDDFGSGSRQCMEAQMNVEVWIELILVIVRVLAAGMAG